MKMLLIHAKSFEYWARRPTKFAERNIKEHDKKENVTLVMIAVEPGDSEKVERAVEEIKKVMGWQHSREAFIYPYAHLSDNLAKPEEAIRVLDEICKRLKAERAPFGWYKEFVLHARGHAMAEFSRRI